MMPLARNLAMLEVFSVKLLTSSEANQTKEVVVTMSPCSEDLPLARALTVLEVSLRSILMPVKESRARERAVTD